MSFLLLKIVVECTPWGVHLVSTQSHPAMHAHKTLSSFRHGRRHSLANNVPRCPTRLKIKTTGDTVNV